MMFYILIAMSLGSYNTGNSTVIERYWTQAACEKAAASFNAKKPSAGYAQAFCMESGK